MSAMLKRREPPSAQFKEDADEEYAATGAGDDDDAFLAAAAAATDAVASQSPAKKAKAGDVRTLTAEKNDEGELFFSLSGKRRATVREFKGKKFLDIREYWEKDGKMLPGKKGIMLPIEQLEPLFNAKDAILALLKS